MIPYQEKSSLEINQTTVKKSSDSLCFNPDCKSFSHRFLNSSLNNTHLNCSGWILTLDQLRQVMSNKSISEIDPVVKNTFDLKQNPLKSIFEIQKLFKSQTINPCDNGIYKQQELSHNNAIELLRVNLQMIKTKLENQLVKVFYQISDRISKINQAQQNTIQQIKNLLTTQDPSKASQSITKSTILKQYKEYCNVNDSLTLIREQKIAKEIFKIIESIENIGNSFWNTDLESVKREKDVLQKARKDIKDLNDFNKDDTIHPYVKVQSLANMFQAKNIQPSVSSDKLSISMQCWICDKHCFSDDRRNIKQRKAEACRELLNHIMQSHQIEATSKFVSQLTKTVSHKITYSQLIAEIEDKNYEEFIIIDRQNSNRGIQPFIANKNSQNTLIIDVLSSQNEHIAVGKYILASSPGKDSADTLIIMMVHAIVTSGYYRFVKQFRREKIPKITIVSKDHFAETLQYIVKSQFNAEIQVAK